MCEEPSVGSLFILTRSNLYQKSMEVKMYWSSLGLTSRWLTHKIYYILNFDYATVDIFSQDSLNWDICFSPLFKFPPQKTFPLKQSLCSSDWFISLRTLYPLNRTKSWALLGLCSLENSLQVIYFYLKACLLGNLISHFMRIFKNLPRKWRKGAFII